MYTLNERKINVLFRTAVLLDFFIDFFFDGIVNRRQNMRIVCVKMSVGGKEKRTTESLFKKKKNQKKKKSFFFFFFFLKNIKDLNKRKKKKKKKRLTAIIFESVAEWSMNSVRLYKIKIANKVSQRHFK